MRRGISRELATLLDLFLSDVSSRLVLKRIVEDGCDFVKVCTTFADSIVPLVSLHLLDLLLQLLLNLLFHSFVVVRQEFLVLVPELVDALVDLLASLDLRQSADVILIEFAEL